MAKLQREPYDPIDGSLSCGKHRLCTKQKSSASSSSHLTVLGRGSASRGQRHGRSCEGFRMPALDRGMFPRREAAGFRKPPKEETAARKRLDVAGAIYGDLRTARGRCGARGTALGRDFDA